MAKQEITDNKTSLISRLDQERCAGLVMSSRFQQPARIGPIGIAFVESQINYGAGSGYKHSRMSGVFSTSLARLFWKGALLERISRVCCLLECQSQSLPTRRLDVTSQANFLEARFLGVWSPQSD